MAANTSVLVTVMVAVCMVAVAVPAAMMATQDDNAPTEVEITVKYVGPNVKMNTGWENTVADTMNKDSKVADAGFRCEAGNDSITLITSSDNETTCDFFMQMVCAFVDSETEDDFIVIPEDGNDHALELVVNYGAWEIRDKP